MKKPKIVVRFSAFSKNNKAANDFNQIKKILPKPNSSSVKGGKRILSDGRIHPNDYEETSYDYKSTFESFDLEEINKNWIDFWIDYFDYLKSINKKYEFRFYLNYEITVYDMNYPSVYIPIEFSKILSEVGIDLSLYIYNDSLEDKAIY